MLKSTTRVGLQNEDSPSAPGTHRYFSRRSFLHGAVIVGATTAVVATGALSYRVYDTAMLNPGHGEAFDPWRTWRDDSGVLGTVAAAILAANPHNSQSWLFHVNASSVDVYADDSRRTGMLDPSGREQHVGLGCAIENLVIAARARGFAPTVELLPPGAAAGLVAHIELAAADAEPSGLYAAIGERHSNRGPYHDKPVTTDELVDMTGLAGVSVHWIADDGEKATLGQLMIDAAIAITEDDEQSRDSFAWFRLSDDAIQKHRDGLTLDMQGLSPLTLTVAKLMPASSRSAGDDFWVKQTRDVHTKTAVAYGIITAADIADVSTQLTGGRLLQRIHLTATHQGVALHHMNQITERIDRERTTGAKATFGPRIAELLPAGVEPLVAFRVGYAERAGRRSPRRALSAVIQ